MVTSQAVTNSSTITFTGTNFLTSMNGSATIAEVHADTVTVSTTEVVATWNMGLPPVASDVVDLFFHDEPAKIGYRASGTVNLTNPLSITGSSAALTCSYAGGCLYEVQAAGLSSLLKQNATQNNIKVCDEVCTFLETNSTSDMAKCKLAKLSTVYSDSTFNISQVSEDLKTGLPFGTLTDNLVPFDGTLVLKPTEGAQVDGGCHIGIGFKEGHVGLISQVKWFLGDISDKTVYSGEAKLQGSNDGTTYTDLFTMDENVHEGWNYFKWEDASSYPRYRFYRFYGTKAGSCIINEIKATGVETVDSPEANKACSAVVNIGATQTPLTSGLITYESTKTPLLTGMNPRHGAVTGGDSVTFTGTGFSANVNDYNVVIDGIVCDVTAATINSVTCTTNKRPGLVESSLEIYI